MLFGPTMIGPPSEADEAGLGVASSCQVFTTSCKDSTKRDVAEAVVAAVVLLLKMLSLMATKASRRHARWF